MYRNQVYIRLPHFDKHLSLCIEHESTEICEGFRTFCLINMPKSLKWFLQSDTYNFKMFECWVDFKRNPNKQDLLFDFGEMVAQKLGLSFDIV